MKPSSITLTATAILLIAAIYVATAKLGFTMAFTAEQVTLVWPPAGLSLAALLLFGTRVWPGVFLGAFLANVTTHEPVVVAVGIAAGNTLEAATAVWLLRRYGGFRPSINRLRDAIGLVVFGAVASTTIGATIGVASLCLSGVQPWSQFGALWRTWWLGDGGGDLLIAPLLLTWSRWPLLRLRRNEALEAGALAAGLVAVNAVVFAGPFTGDAAHYRLEYTVFPFLICAAIRFGIAGAATANVVTSVIAVWGTVHGFGPYAAGQGDERLMLLQLFMGVAAGTGLFLGAAISERNASVARQLGLIEAALDCIITTDHTGRIVEFNAAAEETFGYRHADAIGRDMAELIIPETLRSDYRQGFARAGAAVHGASAARRLETVAIRLAGTEFPVELSITRIPDTNPPMFTSFIRDITEQKRVVKQLTFRATHDGLTRLFNRTAFVARLNDASKYAAAGGGTIAVLFLDIDRFKVINDRLGHGVGDRLLVAAARRLRGCVRPGDTLARLGGDEFAILIKPGTDEPTVAAVADRVRLALHRPFSIDRHKVMATASIGIALSSDEMIDPEDLLRTADSAMYRAKAASRDQATQ
jgi:diguanylate cyclase (GGDEF)-like protein/PAS domain S-box-containing protein